MKHKDTQCNKAIVSRYNQYIEYQHEFNSSLDNIWKIISAPSNLELFHPFCMQNKVILWNGKGSIDELTYLNGKTLRRQFHSWNENQGYDLFIGRKNGRQSFVSWKLESKVHGYGCSLKIRIYPHYYNMKKSITHKILFIIFIKPKLKKYLKSVLLGLNWHLLNKKPIKKNKFGKHSWFS